ncbi:MAG: heavy metal translocating P-type ATPase metal-binding domain-containing protein [Melioribacteraceae bacterium]|nr:heavy metal translocating P-type ATPase metal-binding domain-containing protein [Melioribacteraceae bacterium]MCF8263339.1 heavy metal translocating P-type ATPase metal-binding domain-containing protein [Melioribacteraceae bacterium]MCF8414084.1 heavy metal translocating P-type ATPase metal-binding domain-containing protein [Melioribacteraceae bacterium]
MNTLTENTTKTICYHCGDECRDEDIQINEKHFCCNGCKTVYEILDGNDLCEYYNLDEQPGISQKKEIVRNYDFLEDSDLINKLIDFTDGKVSTVKFYIPQMHCASCIWVLENLNRLNSGVLTSQVNFVKKTVSIKFDSTNTTIKELVILLDAIGYEPALNLEEKNEDKNTLENKKLYYRIGVAGFAFGNIMLLSFPEYLSIEGVEVFSLKQIFGYLSLLLALPVFFYSASQYFESAYKGLKSKIVNIDVPIAIGVFVLFTRSSIEIIFNLGSGYFDSLAGLIFFLLIGKVFQNKTYETLNFERNYKSYFPIAVTIKKADQETTIPVSKLNKGNRIMLKNNELVPADSVLISNETNIDYSFVTGESEAVHKVNGDLIYAGGRQIGKIAEVEVIKEVDQSYLTQLWNNKIFSKGRESKVVSLANGISKYFTIVVLLIAVLSSIYWSFYDLHTSFNVFTAVLIVACPCALALSTPFTLGNTLRIFGRNKFYLKSTEVIEDLGNINSIVFDKTGTITQTGQSKIEFIGDSLNEIEMALVGSAVKNSSHPLSRIIDNFLNVSSVKSLDYYNEIPGSGIEAKIGEDTIQLGSPKFLQLAKNNSNSLTNTHVFLKVNNILKGYFSITNQYRKGLNNTIQKLAIDYSLGVISGDNSRERENLLRIFPPSSEMKFEQSPQEKLSYIQHLQSFGKKVLMIGDGLNDAGALKQSDVGITITEDINNFSPACDAMLDSSKFELLKTFLQFSSTSKKIIIASFIISFIYNAGGLFFAVQGLLSPIIAAILMPLSSISVVIFTTLTTNFFAKSKGLL